MKRIALALLLLGGIAHAQENEQPPPGDTGERFNEPRDSSPGAAKHEVAEDPSTHFNFTEFSYRGKDEYGGTFGDGKMTDDKTGETTPEEEPMSPPFLLALLNFGVLLILLAKFLAPAGRKVAEERHDQIKTALDEASKLRSEAEKKLKEYEGRIAGLDSEIEKLVAGIRADAEADKKRILESAEKQAAQMKRDAESRITAEIEQARAHLQAEVAAASTAAAAKIVRERSTADDQKRMVSTFITGLGGQGGRS